MVSQKNILHLWGHLAFRLCLRTCLCLRMCLFSVLQEYGICATSLECIKPNDTGSKIKRKINSKSKKKSKGKRKTKTKSKSKGRSRYLIPPKYSHNTQFSLFYLLKNEPQIHCRSKFEFESEEGVCSCSTEKNDSEAYYRYLGGIDGSTYSFKS